MMILSSFSPLSSYHHQLCSLQYHVTYSTLAQMHPAFEPHRSPAPQSATLLLSSPTNAPTLSHVPPSTMLIDPTLPSFLGNFFLRLFFLCMGLCRVPSTGDRLWMLRPRCADEVTSDGGDAFGCRREGCRRSADRVLFLIRPV